MPCRFPSTGSISRHGIQTRLVGGLRWPSLAAPSRLCRSQLVPAQLSPTAQPIRRTTHASRRVPPGNGLSRVLSHDAPASTIYALSSAPGRAAIAVIRISGPACRDIYYLLCPNRSLPKPRVAAVRTLHEPSVPPTADTILDSAALVLYFPAPNTVTGEEVLELHVHGGSATIKAVLAAIPRCTTSATGRIHYAEPGEFTRRAFFHNRLDVTQIEALGDSLAAETEQQRRLSVRGTSGALARQYEAWRHQLLQARGELEALIDFSEDQHFDETPTSLTSSVAMQVQALAAQIETFRANAMRGELRRNGLSISLLGAPNVGKSSLLNRIVGREAAIVSTEAGTTRDVIEIGVDIDGWYCRLADMAGIRRTLAKDRIEELAGSREIAPVGLVEHEGIQRAKERAAESDVVILMCSVEPDLDGQAFHLRVDADVLEAAAKINRRTGNVVAVVNKLDRVDDASTRMSKEWAPALMASVAHLSRKSIFGVSCKANVGPSEARADARGIQTLLAGLVEKFQEMTDPLLPTASGDQAVVPTDRSMWEASLGATERQRLLLDECLAHLQTFSTITRASSDQLGHSNDDLDVVVAAESLRAAASSLGKITGKGEAGDVEAVLGVVFEKFCVGK